jgi:hypothetical protein
LCIAISRFLSVPVRRVWGRVGVFQRTFGGRGPIFPCETPLRDTVVLEYSHTKQNYCARSRSRFRLRTLGEGEAPAESRLAASCWDLVS